MSKPITITNGEVVIKDFVSRGLKKKINEAMFVDVSMKANMDGKSELDGLNMTSVDNANDVAMIGMIEKITINTKELPITLATLDALPASDIEKVIAEINAITNKEIPNA